MENLTDISVIKKICAKYGFKFKKGFGQNFLCDESIVESIIYNSKITKDTDVIEIGPGFGSLTQSLLKYAKSVTSVEIDNSLIPVLNELFLEFDNFNLINEDVLKFDLNSIIKSDNTILVANLPYYITTPILTYLLEGRFNLKSITVMVQKEVADRLVAKPGSKDYGAITCLIDYYSKSSIVTNVPKDCFIPAPNVDSAVVKLDILDTPSVTPLSEKNMFKLIKASFNQRRKTFLNGISNSGITQKSKAEIEQIITDLGYDCNLRGETLSVEEFAKISDRLF
ncbi:MAG: 16S rRNA (adenine(1518)-N(6)/adenine(1519)-N(6))-dimethyltransferase RsmA [Clostridia bacterium]|nr:16S rRNA (adenine(1518)-N(6)/adenine(1519)-N(6))-dimethyltransferase RsmA [Oscillospiraceae bacterium]MBR4892364.1 16S rRNA (adenine(1518)-N(6)/adenine(1519)-N(6))-dimethyltransferase RsmA [Clostridia bacterium]